MKPEQRIAALATMSIAEKKAAWREAYRTPAPLAFGTGLLARAIAYRLQENAGCRLSRDELRKLASLAVKDEKVRSGKIVRTIKPGTWLSRTWHGEVHQVVVLERGYEYRGERFTSLSAIAQRITNAKWSGPCFFGLKSSRLGRLGVNAHGS